MRIRQNWLTLKGSDLQMPPTSPPTDVLQTGNTLFLYAAAFEISGERGPWHMSDHDCWANIRPPQAIRLLGLFTKPKLPTECLNCTQPDLSQTILCRLPAASQESNGVRGIRSIYGIDRLSRRPRRQTIFERSVRDRYTFLPHFKHYPRGTVPQDSVVGQGRTCLWP